MVTIDDLTCKLVVAKDQYELMKIDFNMLMPQPFLEALPRYFVNKDNTVFYTDLTVFDNKKNVVETIPVADFFRMDLTTGQLIS